jgi:DNA-binding response OmpR family regulator
VLLVEGHADTRELYELWLTQRAFAVTATASGDAALAAARAHAPDVIVVELMVPDGGVALVRALRAEAGCRDTIMIVVTTQADTALRERALEAGADFYLVKPCGVLRLGEVMVVASRDRTRLVAPETSDAKPSSARIRLALRRSRAIRERLASDRPASSVPPASVN